MERLRASAAWRFLGVLPDAEPGTTGAWWALIAVRATLPALFTLATGHLIGSVLGRQGVALAIVLVSAVFIVQNVLAPIHDALSNDLGALAGAFLHDQLLQGTTTPAGLAHLEQPQLAADLEKARAFDNSPNAPPLRVALGHIAAGFATLGGGLAQALLLFGYRWWAPLLMTGAWLSTHALLRDSANWKIYSDNGPVSRTRRRADYDYHVAVDAPSAKEIRLFGLGDWMADRAQEGLRRVSEAILQAQRLRVGPIRWGLLVVVGAYALLCWSLARDASSGAISLTALVVFAQAAIGSSALAFGEVDWWFRGSAEPIPLLLDLEGRMRTAGGLASGTRTPAGMPAREVRFDKVGFAYPGGDPILDAFDLVVPAGTSLAIVGPNGAGKTTLAKLLCRFYDPTAGAVLVDGVDLRELSIDEWRAQTAAVFQDFARLELSLRENVAPAGAPEAAVERALEAAGAAGLAQLDIVLSRAYEGGTDLSGGQWQRVALARALCQVELGAGLVLLDEPTAQLDVRGEAEIFERILAATRGKTTILISHRFSTVRHVDRICVVEHGRVVELGSHAELMAQGGRYRHMFDLQASRFEEADELDAV